MKLIHILLSTLLLTLSLISTPTDAQCTKPRIRKAWTALTSSEKTLYKDAIAMAMDSGAYIRFTEIHTERMSDLEAHKQCMFVYWHRLFLVAFENMLRGQHSRFACVTIPYWNWVGGYSTLLAGRCRNALGCSPILLENGNQPPLNNIKSLTINGIGPIRGYCANTYPLNHFCESRNVKGSECARCMPRADWGRLEFPEEISYQTLRDIVLTSTNIADFSRKIETRPHNRMHGMMGAVMGMFQSPSDPIFWSHHAMIDAIHSIFHKCKVGEQVMTMAQKVSNPVSWTNCERQGGTRFSPYDAITVRTGYNGGSPLNASRDPLIGKYFNGFSMLFVGQVNTRDMGASSYTYELQGLLGTLYQSCKSPRGFVRDAATKVPPPPRMGGLIKPITDGDDMRVAKFMETSDLRVRQAGGNPISEAQKMMCMHHDQCLGGFKDDSVEFKRKFKITTPPLCKQIIADVKSGKVKMQLKNWKESMVKEFGCPLPHGAQSKASPSDSKGKTNSKK